MTMVADLTDVVVGVDTHRDSHTLQLCSRAGAAIAATSITNTDAGFTAALSWLSDQAPGAKVMVAMEGTRSYGIGLAQAMQAAGLRVIEVEQPRRSERRGRGKSDPIDALLAARHLLSAVPDQLAQPRCDGDREALRILLCARTELTTTSTGQINRLRALLRSGDDTDRNLARGSLTRDTLSRLARRRGHLNETRDQAVRRAELRRLALAVTNARADLTTNLHQLTTIVTDLAPALLQQVGIGPVTAAQAIVSWSHHGRCRNDAAFAALAGVNPIPASSGNTTRHRLNRGGDRHLNAALHRIILTRWRSCPTTAAYINKRRAQGKTDREIRRLLKRYLARRIYRLLENTP